MVEELLDYHGTEYMGTLLILLFFTLEKRKIEKRKKMYCEEQNQQKDHMTKLTNEERRLLKYPCSAKSFATMTLPSSNTGHKAEIDQSKEWC